MVPYADAGRHLNAGQVGVSVVCGLGPCVSYATARHGRSGVCEEPVEADVEQLLSASQRPVACLRMELQRRESAGACLGRFGALSCRTIAVRPGGPGVSRTVFSEA